MKKDKSNLSRRTFLATGSAIVATSLLTSDTKAAPGSNEMNLAPNLSPNSSAPLTNDPVYTESTQTLTNKTISGLNNTITDIGIEYLNVKDFIPTSQADPFDLSIALTDAITALRNSPGRGGQILIPPGTWYTKGGHDLYDSISIEGCGMNLSPHNGTVAGGGTELRLLNSGTAGYVFRITGNKTNCSLKNMLINMAAQPTATWSGLLITNTEPNFVYNTYLENVGFYQGQYGVRVYDTNAPQAFQNDLFRADRVAFVGCATGFYCNTNNGSYEFNSPYFAIAANGTCLDIVRIGQLTCRSYFVAGPTVTPYFPTNNTTFLKTTGTYNNILMEAGQDERIQYIHHHVSGNALQKAITWRNCLIQSEMKFEVPGSLVSDNNTWVNFYGDPSAPSANPASITDGGTDYLGAIVYLHQISTDYVESRTGGQVVITPVLQKFVNPYSRAIDAAGNINAPVLIPLNTLGAQNINATRGRINIQAGTKSVTVYNTMVTADSLIETFMCTVDTNAVSVAGYTAAFGSFTIYLTAAPAGNVAVGFRVISGY